jgi:uncharacterized protein with beta-barrel porin domain
MNFFHGYSKDDPQFDRSKNGSLYDRGGADFYYGRSINPHWYPNGTYKGEMITDLNDVEIDEYMDGWYDARELGLQKEY